MDSNARVLAEAFDDLEIAKTRLDQCKLADLSTTDIMAIVFEIQTAVTAIHSVITECEQLTLRQRQFKQA